MQNTANYSISLMIYTIWLDKHTLHTTIYKLRGAIYIRFMITFPHSKVIMNLILYIYIYIAQVDVLKRTYFQKAKLVLVLF